MPTHGCIYIRDEYPLAFERMQKARCRHYANGLLGDDVLGTGVTSTLRSSAAPAPTSAATRPA